MNFYKLLKSVNLKLTVRKSSKLKMVAYAYVILAMVFVSSCGIKGKPLPPLQTTTSDNQEATAIQGQLPNSNATVASEAEAAKSTGDLESKKAPQTTSETSKKPNK